MQHQKDAIEKISRLKVAALLMDMGTGKTLTAFEWLRLKAHKISKVLFFCPVSVKNTIKKELEKHTDASFYVFNHKTRQNNMPAADFCIIGTESVSSSKRMQFAAMALVDNDSAVIVDESTYIKSPNANRTSWILRIGERAKYRMIMTGTPTANGFQDLFMQFRFLSPMILGYNSYYSFAANHLEYSEKYPSKIVRVHDTARLAEKMKPYVYQVTKEECLDLPPKTFSERYYHLSIEQDKCYQREKELFFQKIQELESYGDSGLIPYEVFKLFMTLQQICSGFIGDTELKSERISTLMQVIEQIPDGKRVVIWAKFMWDVDKIKAALEQEYGDGCVVEYTGRLSEKQKQKSLQLFENRARFVVATQATGGHGINEFVCSHYAVFYSNTFKFAERMQAEDRQHRQGQHNKVHYIDIIAADTIDERIMGALSKKQNILASFQKEIEDIKRQKGEAAKNLKEVIKKL